MKYQIYNFNNFNNICLKTKVFFTFFNILKIKRNNKKFKYKIFFII